MSIKQQEKQLIAQVALIFSTRSLAINKKREKLGKKRTRHDVLADNVDVIVSVWSRVFVLNVLTFSIRLNELYYKQIE